MKMIGCVFIVYLLAIILGKALSKFTGKQYAHFSSYLLSVVEGGNVALPSYLSIVGTSMKDMIKSIFTNSFVIAVIVGLVIDFTGLYNVLLASTAGKMITKTFAQATMTIVSMILFILGYDLNIDKETLKPSLKLMSVKFVYYAFVIVGFSVLFPV
ncbi:MAG: hypothetical protein ACLUVC_12785 [Longibaculum sp.]